MGTWSFNVGIIRDSIYEREMVTAYNNRSGSYFSPALFIFVFRQDTFIE